MATPSHSDKANDHGNSEAKSSEQINEDNGDIHGSEAKSKVKMAYGWICTVLLLVNYFLVQYDKFILSYFSTPLSQSLGL